MKNVIVLSAILILCILQPNIQAQSIGVNTTTPDASAILDVQSTDKGMLVPRMNKLQRLTIPNPAEGLLVFDIDSDAFWYYQDGWKKLSDASKNVWLKEHSLVPAETSDTTIHFNGQIAIGKDSANAQLDIYSENENSLLIRSKTEGENLPIGVQLQLESNGGGQQQGVTMILSGAANSRLGTHIVSNNNDSTTSFVYGHRTNLAYSPLISDSISRQLVGTFHEINGYDNTYQVGTYNRVRGSSYGRQRGTLNLMEGSGDGEHIGTYNIFQSSFGDGERIGTKNSIRGGGSLFGTYQTFNSSSDSTIYGLYNDLDISTHEGKKYGVFNILESFTNDSTQYGIKNQIDGSSNDGDHYGLSNTLESSGSGARYGVQNIISGSSSGRQHGVHTIINNTGSNNHYGILSEIEGSANGQKYGSFQSITNTGSGAHTGTQNTLGGSGTGIKYGTQNSMTATGGGAHYGTKNNMAGGGSGTHYGSHTSMGASGSGNKYADYNSITNSKNGEHYGEYTSLSGAGSGLHYGSNIKLSGNGTGPQYGHLVEITNTGDAAHYGNRATMEGDGNGLQYGNSNVITNSGSNGHYGTHNSLIGPGSGLQFGTYNSINVTGGGAHYGTFNIISGTGTGTHVAGYFDASNAGANRYAAIFNRGKVVVNEASGDYDFRVESNNNQNMLFVDAGSNRVGVGTNAPEKEVDVRGSALIERNSNSSSPQLTLKENGLDYARLTFLNDQVDTTYWSIAGRTNDTDASSRFNIFYNQLGNVMSLQGDGDAVFLKRLAVGTSSPAATLHASSSGEDPMRIQLNNVTRFRMYNTGKISIGGNFDSGIGDAVFITKQVSMGVTNPFYALSLPNDNHEDIGIAIARNWMEYSDQRVKKNVVESAYGLEEVLRLRPVQYDHHSSSFEQQGLALKEDFTREVGFLAQEVYQIIEDVVQKPADESKDLWSMDYEKLTPVLVKAIQEQQLMIDLLKEQNNSLNKELNNQTSALKNELAEIKKALGL